MLNLNLDVEEKLNPAIEGQWVEINPKEERRISKPIIPEQRFRTRLLSVTGLIMTSVTEIFPLSVF